MRYLQELNLTVMTAATPVILNIKRLIIAFLGQVEAHSTSASDRLAPEYGHLPDGERISAPAGSDNVECQRYVIPELHSCHRRRYQQTL